MDVLAQTIPFFALIGLGYGAGLRGMFDARAAAALTAFVFYFALSALLFRFTAGLDLGDVLNGRFMLAYLGGTLAVYLLATLVSLWRGRGMAESAVEAQCAVIGNVGFLGIPMLGQLLGDGAVGPILQVLVVDLIVFGSLIVILITWSRGEGSAASILRKVVLGVLQNPMIVSIALGLLWSGLSLPIPGPADRFLEILGAAATPGALFAIGLSLAGKSAERLSVAAWLSFCKLVLHPLAVAVAAFLLLGVEPFAAGVMVAAAALPVAGNVFIMAQSYAVAPQRASAAILVSTVVSVATVTFVLSRLV
ncbi:hypothetical protein SAMN04488012_102390 [Palleronia salina]|uniref:Malate transporter n=1 Tax=Palleronia salina TaxID=313368 RepID=A0A1M6DHF7_9RHOB|nr:AEC family transporter [Palleronia salina]SHI72533.1 hypothetical protein SAMN04488012_102390 [Palleronia salina]